MSESIHEQIVVALQTLFGGIVGDGGAAYWYTPTRVVRAAAFHSGLLDDSLSTIYCLSPADEDDEFRDSNREVKTIMRVDLALATRFTEMENPLEPTDPDRWKVQNRLIRDAKKRIRSDYRLGGLCLWIEIPTTERGAEQTFEEGWALAFLRLLIFYRYADTAP